MVLDSLVSVILPVYNRHKYLGLAIDSVLNQTYQNWELVIADDASELTTRELLETYSHIPQVKVHFNSENLGLFPNLNQAIRRSTGDYILLLCSDDFLLPECLELSIKLGQQYPDAGLLLSPVQVVDAQGENLDGNAVYYEKYTSQPSQLLNPSQTLPLLLHYGSINGNLTGMFFKRELYEKVGGFREDWRHAADWEWLYRAASQSLVIISKTPRATMRSHSEQLSGVNFRNLSNSLEVIDMVRILRKDPLISKVDSAERWALHLMQYHLWFALKMALQGRWTAALTILRAINNVTGFGSTLWAMLRWLPQRWQVYTQKSIALPPD